MTQTTTEKNNGLAIPNPGALAVQPTPMTIALATYSDPQVVAVIRNQICPDATPPEMWQFLARCVSLGLDPFSGQLYFIKRQGKVSHQIGIDGFRSIADRTGELVGISEPDFEFDENGLPSVARVTVLREIKDKDRSFVGVARWKEFVPSPPNDFMWKKMPTHMLAKCAEAQAMRRAFPQKMGGLQTDAEALSAEEVVGAQLLNRGAPKEPQYIEVTDTTTGEMKQVRAGDEYVRQYEGAYQEEAVPAVRQQTPDERPAYAEGNATARRAADELTEVIDQADSPTAPPEVVGNGSDSSTTNEVAKEEPLDYQRCLEIYQAHSELTIDKPLARQSADYYRHWHDEKFVPALEKAGNLPF